MKKLIILLPMCVLLLLIGCGSEKPEAKRTVIAGRILNLTEQMSQTMMFHPFDILSSKSKVVVKIENDGSFHIEHDYAFPQLANFRHAQFISFYVEPGDSLYITIDMADPEYMKNITFSGDNAETSEQLHKWITYTSGMFPYPEMSESATTDNWREALHVYAGIIKDSLDAYSARNPMNETAYRIAEADGRFTFSQVAMDYKGDDALAIFEDPAYDNNNPHNIETQMFLYHLYPYLRAIQLSDPTLKKMMENKETIPLCRKTMEYISKKANGVVKDYMMCVLLSGFIKEDGTSYIYDSLVAGKGVFDNLLFEERLKALTYPDPSSWLNTYFPDKVLYYDQENGEQSVNAEYFTNYLTDRYKGKILYVDVWATWCSPCREEIINYSPALHTEYENKDVVFINLCMQSSRQSWQNSIKDMPVHGENYFLEPDPANIFMSAFNVSGFPSYMIIDKFGKIVTLNGPRPSQPEEIKKIVEELL